MKTGLGSDRGLISFSSSLIKLLVAVGVASAMLLLTACGGGGTSTPPPPPPPASTVTFTSTAPTAASEGQAYTYQISATESSGAAVTYSLTSGPDGATVSGSTLSWTPTHAQSRKANSFTIKGTSSKGATATQTFSVSPIGTINGKGSGSAVSSQGTVTQNYDWSNMPTGTLAAIVPNGSGQYTTIDAVGNSDGTFTIPGVPPGYFWLRQSNYFFWMNGNDIDLSQITLGRRNGAIPNPVATINFDITLTTLTIADDWFFGWYVPNQGYLSDMPVGTLESPEWTYTMTWGGPYYPPLQLLDADQGDIGYFFRRHASTSGDLLVGVIGESYAANSMHMTSGGTVNVAGNSTAVTQNMSFRANIDGSAFAALHPAITPHPGNGSVGNQHGVYVRPQPYTPQHGSMANDWENPAILAITSRTNTDTLFQTDRDMGDIAYGNPFLEPSTRYVHVMDYRPIAERGGYLAAGYGSVTTSFPTATQPIRPVIGPVSSPKIDGQDMFACSSNCPLSTTPTISWTKPTLGNADYYAVMIAPASSLGTFLFWTTATTMTVPPGILQSGKSYMIAIGAYSTPNGDYSKPLIQPFPHSWAQAIASFTTPGTAPAANVAESDALNQPEEEVIDMFGAPVLVKRGGQ